MMLYKQDDIVLAVDTLKKYGTKCHGSIFLEEWAYLYRFIRYFKPKIILEIGSWYHVSSLAFLTALSHNGGGQLISIDLNFPLKIEFDDDKVRWIKMNGSSLDIVPLLNKNIDLAFVDGNHGDEAVENDLKNCLGILNNDGHVMVHDVNYKPTIDGVSRVLDINDCFMWSSQPDKFHGILVYPKP